jgi:hypothetical protein
MARPPSTAQIGPVMYEDPHFSVVTLMRNVIGS